MAFVDPRTTPFVRPHSRGELPHLYKSDGMYFVTFRLYDAVVSSTGNRSQDLDDAEPAAVVGAYDPPVCLGSCLLGTPEAASIVEGAIRFFEHKRYSLTAWCIMPNHVHVIVTPLDDHSLDSILHSWKSFSAHELNKRTGQRGPVWERESFDHLIRSEESLDAFIEYVEQNPVVAGLSSTAESWAFSSASVEKPASKNRMQALPACAAGTAAPQ